MPACTITMRLLLLVVTSLLNNRMPRMINMYRGPRGVSFRFLHRIRHIISLIPKRHSPYPLQKSLETSSRDGQVISDAYRFFGYCMLPSSSTLFHNTTGGFINWVHSSRGNSRSRFKKISNQSLI